MCPTDPEDRKKIEERFRNRWNVPHAVGALDGKHITIKKPKKSGSEYFNFKGYFSLVLLALVDADYEFLWVNMGASGSSSDAQVFNDAFALMPWLVKPYSRRQLTREERIANYRIARGRRVVENSFGILAKRFRVPLTTMEQRQKVVRDIVLTCVVLHNMLRSHQGAADHPLQLTTGKQRHHENLRNPSREAKHQQDLLKDYFNHLGALAGQADRV